MICGSGDADCCRGGVSVVDRRLRCLEEQLSELMERFEALLDDLDLEEVSEEEDDLEEEKVSLLDQNQG